MKKITTLMAINAHMWRQYRREWLATRAARTEMAILQLMWLEFMATNAKHA